MTCPRLQEGRGEAEENQRPEGAGGRLVRKGSRGKGLPNADSELAKIWAGRVLTEHLLCTKPYARSFHRHSPSVLSTAWQGQCHDHPVSQVR